MAGEAAAETRSRPGFHGWRLVASTTSLQFLFSVLMTQSFGAYVAVLRDSEGWSKTALSGVAAMQQVEGALLGPLQGWVIDRFGPRGMVTAGVVLFGVGLMLLGSTQSLAGFYAVYILIALGMSLAGYFSLSITLINWFHRYRSRALSILVLGTAAAGFAAPGIAWSLQVYGWRHTALVSGLVALLVGLPLARTLHRRPEDLGQHVDGIAPLPRAQESQPTVATAQASPSRDASIGEALRTPAFWLLGLGHGSALFVVSAFQVHAITHVKEGLGYSLAQAALLLSVQTLAYTVGVLLSGVVGDRWDKRRISAFCLLLHALGLLLLAYASTWETVLAAGLAHGFAWGFRGPLMQAIRADYFGRESIGKILGASMLLVLIGQVGGPIVAGVLADATGNYRLGFTILATLAGLGSVFFLMLPKPPAKEVAAAK
ncbi:MAG: putative sialic acid transporter [Pseudomonadota bacterium]